LAFCVILSEVLHARRSSISSCAAVERREFLFTTEKLDLDLAFLMAVDRFTTGANVHKIRGLAHAYVLACENNQASKAEEYLSRLLGELGRCKA
jgi:hypothetical protein